MPRERDILLNVRTDSDSRGLVRAANDLEKLSRGVDTAGGNFRDFSNDTKRLSIEIERTTAHVKDLQLQIAKTGDEGLFGDLRREERRLRNLQSVLVAVGGTAGGAMGAAAGRGLLDNLAENIGALPSKLRGTAILAGIGLGAVMAPFLGGVISSAVLGTVGGGGVIGGAILAARDPRVQGAWKGLGQDIMHQLEPVADAFVDPLIRASTTFGKAFREAGITQTLQEASKLVDPLVAGFAGMARELGPGFAAGVKGALPTFQVLGDELPQLGAAISSMLKSLASVGPQAAIAMRDLFDVLEAGTVATGEVLATLTELYALTRTAIPPEVFIKPGVLIMARDGIKEVNEQLGITKIQSIGARVTMHDLGGGIQVTAAHAKELQDALDKANTELKETVGIAFQAEDATLAFEEGLDRLRDSVKGGNKSLSEFNDKGRENRRTLDGIIRAAYDTRDAILAEGHGTETAQRLGDAAFDKMIAKAREVALKLGLPKGAVDALITSLNKVPASRSVKISAPGASKAKLQVLGLRDAIDDLHGKTITINTKFKYGPKPIPLQHGGPVYPGGAYVVGEKRPELFVPDVRGRIEPKLPTGRGTAVGGNTYNINLNVTPGSDLRAAGKYMVEAIKVYEHSNGKRWRTP